MFRFYFAPLARLGDAFKELQFRAKWFFYSVKFGGAKNIPEKVREVRFVNELMSRDLGIFSKTDAFINRVGLPSAKIWKFIASEESDFWKRITVMDAWGDYVVPENSIQDRLLEHLVISSQLSPEEYMNVRRERDFTMAHALSFLDGEPRQRFRIIERYKDGVLQKG